MAKIYYSRVDDLVLILPDPLIPEHMITASEAHFATTGNWNLLCPFCRGPTGQGWMIAKTDDRYYWQPE